MVVGPFDGRKKRSRCQACWASHLRCSGEAPCTNCERRQIACTFGQARSQPVILVERGKQTTLSDWACKAKASSTLSIPSSVGLGDGDGCYFYYFDVFARANNFTGRKRTLDQEMRQHAFHSEHLLDAMLALGALQAVKLRAPDIPSLRQGRTSSLEHYSKAIIGLRATIDHIQKDAGALNTILWTTLLLGLFDLMSEGTGHGWGQHMVHGTARALEASGPASCRSQPGRDFYMQARVFEVSRTILSNQSSFLARPEWMALSREMSGQPLDSLLDIMIMCSQLCSILKIGQTILESDADGQPAPEARAVCADGHVLREALDSWRNSYATESHSEDDSMLLSRVFYAAISIYLSGIFDYGMTRWDRLGLAPSTLDAETIGVHVDGILGLTSLALDTTSLSPLLFLFPLRIAGARSRMAWQREWVTELVGRIAGGFAAARAVQMELDELWDEFGVGCLAMDRMLED